MELISLRANGCDLYVPLSFLLLMVVGLGSMEDQDSMVQQSFHTSQS